MLVYQRVPEGIPIFLQCCKIVLLDDTVLRGSPLLCKGHHPADSVVALPISPHPKVAAQKSEVVE